jgi:Tol biopolymer transport system component
VAELSSKPPESVTEKQLQLVAAVLAVLEERFSGAMPAVEAKTAENCICPKRQVRTGKAASMAILLWVAALTERMVGPMMRGKRQALTLVFAVVILVGEGGSPLTGPHRLWAGGDGKEGAANRGVPEGLIVWKQAKLVFLTAEGKEIKDVPLPVDRGLVSMAVSPDRKRIAIVANEVPPVDRDGNYMRHVRIWDLAGAGKPSQVDLKAQTLAWTASGNLLVVEAASRKDLQEKKFTTSLVNPTTNKAERLELPAGVQALAAMPDEKSFVARTHDAEKSQSYLDLIGRDGKRIDRMTEVIDREFGFIFRAPVLSPDGSRLLFMDADLKEKLEKDMPRLPQLFVYDIKAKKRVRLADVPLNAFILGYAWSPDSRKVAYAWKRVESGVPIVINSSNKDDPKLNTETESFVVVADANGGNAKTVHSAKGPTGPTITIRDLYWR